MANKVPLPDAKWIRVRLGGIKVGADSCVAPCVSVIMAAYRTEQKYFEEAVNSILSQTFRDFEFLLVDDGLTEENREWLHTIEDQRLHVLVNETNIGQSRSVNRALKVARGKYVVRMDADDVAVQTRIERQVSFMEANPELTAAGAQVRFLGTDKVRPRLFSDEEELRATLALRDPLIHPTMVLRLESLKKAGVRYNEEILYAQDYMLWVDLTSVGKIALQPEIVLEYRVHEGQISHKKVGAQSACANQARLKYLRSLGVDATLRDAELLGEIANGTLKASNQDYNEVCNLITKSAKREDVNLDSYWIRRLLASHTLRSVLVGLKLPGGIKRLTWGRFWAALLCVPYWPYYVRAKRS